MWSGSIHDKEFVEKVLEHVEANETNYGTSPRMKGMLAVAKEVCNIYFYQLKLRTCDAGFPATVCS